MERGILKSRLNDLNCVFDKNQLQTIISDEFLQDDQQLDIEIVDAALKRLLLLNGVEPTEAAILEERKRMIRRILEAIFNPHNEKGA